MNLVGLALFADYKGKLQKIQAWTSTCDIYKI